MTAGRYPRWHAAGANGGAPAGDEVERLAEALGCAAFLPQPLDSLSKGTLRKMMLIGAVPGHLAHEDPRHRPPALPSDAG